MTTMATDDELDDFLERIDKIGNIISDLNSSNSKIREDAQVRADDYLASEKTGYNKTVINKSKEIEPTHHYANTNEFLNEISRDAEERAQRRKVNNEKAEQLKRQGNECYRLGKFDEALDLYTKGLNLEKDNVILYTNRAQTYFKLGQYQEAISDCDTALMFLDQSFKAHLVKGRALIMLKEFDSGMKFLEKAISIDSLKKNMIESLIDEAIKMKAVHMEEQLCMNFYKKNEKEFKTFLECIENLNSSDRSLMFYKEQMKQLTPYLNNNHTKILFRIKGGFNIVNSLKIFNDLPNMTEDKLELILVFLDMCYVLCDKNVENQEKLLGMNKFSSAILDCLENCSLVAVQKKILELLLAISVEDKGPSIICCAFNNLRLLKILLNMIKLDPKLGTMAASLFNNIALEESFRQKLISSSEVVEPFIEHMQKKFLNKHIRCTELPSVISGLGNLSVNCKVREIIGNLKIIWSFSLIILENTNTDSETGDSKLSHALLSLLVNLCSPCCPSTAKPFAKELICKLVPFVDKEEHFEYACTVIRHIITLSQTAFKEAQKLNFELCMLHVLQNESANHDSKIKRAIQVLATMTKFSKKSRKSLLQNKGLTTLIQLINHHRDETILGNAILCLTHCIAISAVVKALVSTNIVEQLLDIIKNNKNEDLIKNAAILLSKLSKLDERYLFCLRSLDGVRILHCVLSDFKMLST